MDEEPDQIDASVLAALAVHFPKFARTLDPAISGPYNTASPPATEEQIAKSERSVGVILSCSEQPTFEMLKRPRYNDI